MEDIYREKYEVARYIYDELLPREIDKKVLPSKRIKLLHRAYDYGMLRVKELDIGHEYLGICRDGYLARWNGRDFVYPRWEMTEWIDEIVPHPFYDTSYDIFVPVFNVTHYIKRCIFGAN